MNSGYVLKLDMEKFGIKPKPNSHVSYKMMKREENAELNALEDAKRSAMMAAGISKVEVFCINTVLEEMKKARLKPDSEEYMRISRATARLVIRDRIGMWTRYYTDKDGLKEWILWKLGLKKVEAFDKMKRMGLNGDVLHDMEILERRSQGWE